MAYDPTDAADRKIVADAVKKALEDAQTEHEEDVKGLKAKNKELLAKIAKGGEGGEDTAKLESELEQARKDLKDAVKARDKATKDLEETTTALNAEKSYSTKTQVENDLTAELVKANVASQFLPAVKSLLAGKVSIKTDGESRLTVVGDKSLGDFVKEWSQGDEGKVYVAAKQNSGGGATGGKPDAGSVDMLKLSPVERINQHRQAQAAAQT
jgi:chromosome segregation ATPase